MVIGRDFCGLSIMPYIISGMRRLSKGGPSHAQGTCRGKTWSRVLGGAVIFSGPVDDRSAAPRESPIVNRSRNRRLGDSPPVDCRCAGTYRLHRAILSQCRAGPGRRGLRIRRPDHQRYSDTNPAWRSDLHGAQQRRRRPHRDSERHGERSE